MNNKEKEDRKIIYCCSDRLSTYCKKTE